MSDYKLTRDAAGKVTTQYGQMLKNLEDELMGDELVKRARHNAKADMPHHASVSLLGEMADRIEELEANLKKAAGALGDISNGEPEWPDDPQRELGWCRNRATTTLAELKGETDD